jgi:hypothetical protein
MSTTTNSSTSSTREKATDDKQEGNTALPVVDGISESFVTPQLTTTADKGQAAIQRHTATIRKLKEQEYEIAQQHERLQHMIDALESRRQDYMELEFNLPPPRFTPTETPGPHRLLLKAERPSDLAYKQQQVEQQQAEQLLVQAEAQQDPGPDTPEKALMTVFQSLTKVLSDNNKHLHSSDVTEPATFDGQDSQWDDWYLQLRTYFEAKGWLSTFEHPTATSYSTHRFVVFRNSDSGHFVNSSSSYVILTARICPATLIALSEFVAKWLTTIRQTTNRRNEN